MDAYVFIFHDHDNLFSYAESADGRNQLQIAGSEEIGRTNPVHEGSSRRAWERGLQRQHFNSTSKVSVSITFALHAPVMHTFFLLESCVSFALINDVCLLQCNRKNYRKSWRANEVLQGLVQ
jgi:hypothetical protein